MPNPSDVVMEMGETQGMDLSVTACGATSDSESGSSDIRQTGDSHEKRKQRERGPKPIKKPRGRLHPNQRSPRW